MPATFRIHQTSFSIDAFIQYVNTYPPFEGLETAHKFVSDWKSNKPSFTQKTSGSTGKPGIHNITREQMLASANRTVQALDLKEGLEALVCVNMGYIGGKMMIVRGLAYHWQLSLIPPVSFANPDDIPAGQFDFAAMVPLQIENLLQSVKGIKLLNSIDKIIVGGASLGQHLIKPLQSLKARVYATYGMTETVSHIALQPLNGLGKSGHFHLLSGIDYEIDQRGCLAIRADVTNHEWIQTNDIVQFKNQHEFTLSGRADNVINSGGVKIQTEQLEAKLAPVLKEYTSDFAITQQPDRQLGKRVVLVCEGLTADKGLLIKLLKTTLDKFEVPKVIVQSEIPRTITGKKDRKALQNIAENS